MGSLSAVVPLGGELSIPNCICLGANSANQGSHPREEWGSWGPGTPVGPTSVGAEQGHPGPGLVSEPWAMSRVRLRLLCVEEEAESPCLWSVVWTLNQDSPCISSRSFLVRGAARRGSRLLHPGQEGLG